MFGALYRSEVLADNYWRSAPLSRAPLIGAGGMRPEEANCPNRRNHTKCPDDYLAWHEWAEKKAKTHLQVRCPGCRLFAIWKKKVVALSRSRPLEAP